jgi:hypothetical protein
MPFISQQNHFHFDLVTYQYEREINYACASVDGIAGVMKILSLERAHK